MRPLLYFFAFILLLACNDESTNGFFGSKKEDAASKNSKPVATPEDSIVYAENVSPDGSWQININLKEGAFWGYTITYDSGKIITKKINSGVELIGKMKEPKTTWVNDSTYKIHNIGASTNGYYELIIYKSASCKYIKHLKEDSDTTLVDELKEGTEDNLAPKDDENTPPETINSYSQTDNYIVFTQSIKDAGNKNIGCSSGESTLSIVIQNYTDSFEYNNEELSAVKLNYRYSGGLYEITGDKPFKGYLKGKLLDDNTWKLEMDVWISAFSYTSNEKEKKQIRTSGIFKP